ncbi:hypothetical protein [Rhizorhapis sp.]|uniref:hypothetical protein n=1 Tax=Rhizorhapis sp. TaxID=1968842 RepID=UPI002B470E66|nr:hypothetical protein [Rhizorhapis sp.]HKR17454.1 hypothetical protein [Rhizorhapis sp.]
MNDFLARSSIQSSPRLERASIAVSEAQASGQMASGRDGKRANAALPEGDVDQQLSSAAEVAEAQAKIAALLSEIDGVDSGAPLDADALEAQIMALLPRPTIIVPLPPASRDVVERAVQIAETIRASAMLALAAQANVESGLAGGSLA